MRRECRERFLCHRLQRKPLVSDPGMHHGTCVTHVSWCMSGSLTRGDGENVPGIPGACANRIFKYLARGPCWKFNYCFDISMYSNWNKKCHPCRRTEGRITTEREDCEDEAVGDSTHCNEQEQTRANRNESKTPHCACAGWFWCAVAPSQFWPCLKHLTRPH